MDTTQKNQISLVTAPDCPAKGVFSCATIGLADQSVGMIGSLALGIELVGACRIEFPRFTEVMAACAFNVIHGRARLHPGAVFNGVISGIYSDLAMKHILFITPYGWSEEFLTLEFPSRWVSWLMALPISDAELKFFNTTESGELLERLVESGADIYDLKRASII